MVFTVLTLAQMAHLLAIQSRARIVAGSGVASNLPLLGAVALTLVLQLATIYVPLLQPIFRTQALSGAEPGLALCFGLATIVFVAVEIEKTWRRRSGWR